MNQQVISSTFGLGPPEYLALLIGTLVSVGITQLIKKATHNENHPWGLRFTAFVIGGFATYTAYPPVGVELSWPALWAGVIVGLWTPTAFKIFKVFAKKRQWAWAEHL